MYQQGGLKICWLYPQQSALIFHWYFVRYSLGDFLYEEVLKPSKENRVLS